MRALRQVSLLVVAVSFAAVEVQAQCAGAPVIPNFQITHTPGSYTISWDTPAGVGDAAYQVLQATAPLFCPFVADVSQYSVIATTSAKTLTVQKTTANVAYFVFVRLQSNNCIATIVTHAADSFSAPPAKPVATSFGLFNGLPNVTFSYTDLKAVAIWLYRVADQRYMAAASPCSANPKTLIDPTPLQGGNQQYRLVAFNTGNSAGLAGVASDLITIQASNPPEILSFSAIPQTIRAGQSATLSWRVANATSVFIDNGIGTQPASGSVTVTPSKTTTYNLTAIGNPNAGAQVTVEVITAPSIVVSALASPMLQTAGTGGATTSYTLTNAGGSSTTVLLGQSGQFFTQSPAQFALAAGASQVVTVTGLAQSAGAFEGAALVSGAGAVQNLRVPIKLLSTTPPAQPVSARPETNRVDVAGEAGGQTPGTISFTNSGAGTLTGVLVSDVPWIIPQSGIVSIPPQSSARFSFTIDRSQRPQGGESSESSSSVGSVAGNISLVFPNAVSGKTPITLDAIPPSVSTVAVVDTVKLNATSGSPTALAPGEVALFIPGVGHVQGSVGLFISDISVLNPSGNAKVDDLRLYYAAMGSGAGATKTASVPTLNGSVSVAFADVVKNVFAAEAQVGTLQIRSKLAAKLSVNTNVFNSSNPAGTYGTAIPTLRSDRSAGPGEKVVLTGLRQDNTAHTNFFFQETSGGTATVQTEFFGADGIPLGTRSDTVSAFGASQVNNVAPPGAVSAVMTNAASSTGRFLAFATPVDDRSGDNWSVVDWSRQYGYAAGDTIVVPVAGTLRGANDTFFRTDLAVMNTGTGQASGTLRYVSSAGVATDRQITIGARQTSILADVVGTLFGLSSTSGYLTFTPVTGTFAMTSRTYATVGDNPGTFGTHVPALTTAQAMTLGAVRGVGGIEDSALATVLARRPATFRTNFGMTETSGNPVSVRVTLRFTFPAGATLNAVGTASKTYDLAPNQFMQINGMTADILGAGRGSLGDLRGVTADFQIVGGTGAVSIFLSSTDNGTGDSILRTE
jgi:hypothetical protein